MPVKSTTVYLDAYDTQHPEDDPSQRLPPAYLYWRDTCYVEPARSRGRWGSGRRVVAFQDLVVAHGKDNAHINRSLPQAVYGFSKFNIHTKIPNESVAVREEWLGFGSAGDGFYRMTNYVDWWV